MKSDGCVMFNESTTIVLSNELLNSSQFVTEKLTYKCYEVSFEVFDVFDIKILFFAFCLTSLPLCYHELLNSSEFVTEKLTYKCLMICIAGIVSALS